MIVEFLCKWSLRMFLQERNNFSSEQCFKTRFRKTSQLQSWVSSPLRWTICGGQWPVSYPREMLPITTGLFHTGAYYGRALPLVVLTPNQSLLKYTVWLTGLKINILCPCIKCLFCCSKVLNLLTHNLLPLVIKFEMKATIMAAPKGLKSTERSFRPGFCSKADEHLKAFTPRLYFSNMKESYSA